MKRGALYSLAVVLMVAISNYVFPQEDPQSLFDQAIVLKSNARNSAVVNSTVVDNADVSTNSDPSVALFSRAADLFESKAAIDFRFWYESGNARWWEGRADRAVIDYRRYLSRDPFRSEVWENLSQAREAAGTKAPGGEGLLRWPWFLWLGAGTAFFAGLSVLLFSLYLFFRTTVLKKNVMVFVACTIVCVVLGAASFALRGDISVVLIETQGRKGDSSVYAPLPTEKWKAGQEVWILETRDTWIRARVGSTVFWVPSESLSQ